MLFYAYDLIGPLPETPRINKFIMTVSCLFSKWPEATALPDKTAVGVVEFLLHETMDENLLTRCLISSHIYMYVKIKLFF